MVQCNKQAAQLWQTDRAKLEMFSINVHRYSQNDAQNCIVGPPYVRIGGNVSALIRLNRPLLKEMGHLGAKY